MEQVSVANLFVVAVAMAVAPGLPALFPRLPVPGVVLEIALGAVVGPQVLGLVHPGTTLNLLADFGLAMLFLTVGFEIDPAIRQGRPIPNAVAGGQFPW